MHYQALSASASWKGVVGVDTTSLLSTIINATGCACGTRRNKATVNTTEE